MHRVLDFLYTYFHTYDVTTEVVVFVLITVFAVIIRLSNPENTFLLRLFRVGMYQAALSIVLHIVLLGSTITMGKSHNMIPFAIIYVAYSIVYITAINFISIYMAFLSYERRLIKNKIYRIFWGVDVVLISIMLWPLFTRKLLEYSDGIYSLTKYSNVYILCSLICELIVAIIAVSNRKDVTPIIYWGSVIFIPVEIIGTIIQFYLPNAYFICAMYTLPFVVFYVLFHANKYNEITGCQGGEAEKRILQKYLKNKTQFLHISLHLFVLETRELTGFEEKLYSIVNSFCRMAEKINSQIRIYEITPYKYDIICPVKNDKEYERVKSQILDMVFRPWIIGGVKLNSPANILISGNLEEIESADEYITLLNLKSSQFDNLKRNQILYVTDADAKEYKKNIVIEKNLLDIRNKGDLDDERVQVFLQPIYCIETNSFRTGESLMRMKIDGKMVYPNDFIPVAERLGCIHSLTRIMLHKVALKTKEMDDVFDYDALTVNVSTMEIIDSDVCDEFIEIIKEVGADPSRIRIEITESVSIADYDAIENNISKMNDFGIRFYLDDFGTGYSNLERMISIPFKTIKFDKSLLYKAVSDKKSKEFLLTLSKFFKESGFSTVIEGVENEEQRNLVKAAGIDFIQGFYYSKPLPVNEALGFFSPDENKMC